MQQRIEYAIRQSLDARQRANECSDYRTQEAWLKAAGLWTEIAEQYRVLVKLHGDINLDNPAPTAA